MEEDNGLTNLIMTIVPGSTAKFCIKLLGLYDIHCMKEFDLKIDWMFFSLVLDGF